MATEDKPAIGSNKLTAGGISGVQCQLPFDVRLIEGFDGSTDVVEWWTRTELLCRSRSIDVATVVPLRLTGGAFSVWSQLPEDCRSKVDEVRKALYAAYALDQHAAFEAFTRRRLLPGESADVFLAELRRLTCLFGGVSEKTLSCAFVAGLPESVKQVIRSGSLAESLNLQELLIRSRAVLSSRHVSAAAAPERAARVTDGLRRTQRRETRRCWNCGVVGHISSACSGQGNEAGRAALAPVVPPQ